MPFRLIQCVLTCEYGLNNFFIGLAIEWRVAAQQDVQDDTAAPKIALLVIALLENLRSDVVRRAVLLDHLLAWSVRSGSAEVDNSNACLIARPIEKKIFWFQVSMHYVTTVAIVYRR